jgi:hypothetical protein
MGFLSRGQRRWSWAGFVALSAHRPAAAWLLPADSWLLSVTVAGLVAMVIIADDVERRRRATADADR